MGRRIEDVRAELVAAVAGAEPTTAATIAALRKKQQKYIAYKDYNGSTLVPTAVYVGDAYAANPNDEDSRKLYTERYKAVYEQLTEERRAYFRNYNAYWDIESEIIRIQALADGDTSMLCIEDKIRQMQAAKANQ